MNILNFLYHAGIINDNGVWDNRPIYAQEENLERFASLIVKAVAKVATEESGGNPELYHKLLTKFKVNE